ncbi:MAG: class I SAM-dependent methyltransferase [Verrucomicrobiota bacterium]|nr:class I SAM-dependent methyltransferase [Verrucomicrobiota bacterium]
MMTRSAPAQTGMSDGEIETMRSVEDDLWWYRGLRGHVVRSIKPPHPGFSLLDAGCGTGGMLARVRANFPAAAMTGLDYSERALELTERRNTGATLEQGSADLLPLADAAFDVVLSLDVLVLRGVDDGAAIREMRRVLRPGGTLIVNVAAFDFLRGSHDAATNMARRYTRPRLRNLLEQAGFTIENMSYWNMTLLPAVALVRWTSRQRAEQPDVQSDLKPIWSPLNAALSVVAHLELAATRVFSLPFGTSLFVLARK